MGRVVSLNLDQMVDKLMQLHSGEGFDFAGSSIEENLRLSDLSSWYGAQVIKVFDQDVLMLGHYGWSPIHAISLSENEEDIRYSIKTALADFDLISWDYEGCYVVEEYEEKARVIKTEHNDNDPVDTFVKEETKRLLGEIPEERLAPVWDYAFCELDTSFVGFIDKYATLNIPEDFTVIDIGCNQAVQAYYFKDHDRYIGVDPAIPVENRLVQDNAEYYSITGQDFIEYVLPSLIENGLNLNKTFAICSAVPDEVAQKRVAKTFPYHQVTYPGYPGIVRDVVAQRLPTEPQKTKAKPEMER